MWKEFNLFFEKYGVRGFLSVIVATVVLWGLAHWMSKPGEPVSVLWGLVQYTKQQTEETKLAGIETSEVQTEKLSVPVKEEILIQETISADTPKEVEDVEKGPVCEILKVNSNERIYISQSMEDIIKSISGVNDLQRDENFNRLYKGKWIRVSGPATISKTKDRVNVNFQFGRILFAQFEMKKSENDKISHLPNDTILIVEGQLDYNIANFKIGLINGIVIELP